MGPRTRSVGPTAADERGNDARRRRATPTAGVDPDARRPDADGGTTPTMPATPRSRPDPQPTSIAITPERRSRVRLVRERTRRSSRSGCLPTTITPARLRRSSRCTRARRGATGSASASIPTASGRSATTSRLRLRRPLRGRREDRAYLYVIARDGSLRIVDVFVPGDETECETNFDALDPQLPTPSPDSRVPGAMDAQRCIPYDGEAPAVLDGESRACASRPSRSTSRPRTWVRADGTDARTPSTAATPGC